MVNSNTGVNFNIFLRIIDKYGDTVVLTPTTITSSNIEGDEVSTDGTTESITAYIVRKNRPWHFDKAGFIEGGDAVMLVKPTQTITRGYKVTWNGNTYRVDTVLNRDQIGGNVAYKSCNLFLI